MRLEQWKVRKGSSMNEFLEKWKRQVRELKTEVYALYLAYKDPRVPWYARAFTACIVGYALSPIDLIPDFIPVIGYLDDLVLIPLGIKLALSMIPENVMNESREKAQEIIRQGKPVNRTAAIIFILIWVCLVVLGFAYVLQVFQR